MKYDFNTLHLLWAIRNIPSNLANSQEKIVLYTLLACTGSQNESWHSQPRMAEMCSISEASIKRTLKKLVQKNLIKIGRPTVNHRTASNHYRLCIDYLMTFISDVKGITENPIIEERGSHRAGKGFTVSSRRGSQGATKKEREERKKNGATLASDDAALRPPPEREEEPVRTPAPQWFKDWRKAEKEKRKLGITSSTQH